MSTLRVDDYSPCPAGLDIDWLHRRLYFTNSWTTPVHLDGAVVERSSLESIDLDGTNRLVLLAHLQQPVAVCVDVNNRYVAWLIIRGAAKGGGGARGARAPLWADLKKINVILPLIKMSGR